MNSAGAMAAAGWGPGAIALAALIATAGALLIHWFNRRRGAHRPLHPGAVASSDANPPAQAVSLPEVRAAMRDVAARMGIEERLLPAIAMPSGADGEFVYRDEGGYVYCGYERGSCSFERRPPDLDDLLYRVFHDRAWMQSYLGLIGQDLTPDEHAARLAEAQEAVLAKADPRWAERLRQERDLAGAAGSLQN